MRGRVGGGEGREVTSKLSNTWWATGRPWAFPLCEVGTMESSEQRKDMP